MSCCSTDTTWLSKRLKKPKRIYFRRNLRSAHSSQRSSRMLPTIRLTTTFRNLRTRSSMIFLKRLRLRRRSMRTKKDRRRKCKSAHLSLTLKSQSLRPLIPMNSSPKVTTNRSIESESKMRKRKLWKINYRRRLLVVTMRS